MWKFWLDNEHWIPNYKFIQRDNELRKQISAISLVIKGHKKYVEEY